MSRSTLIRVEKAQEFPRRPCGLLTLTNVRTHDVRGITVIRKVVIWRESIWIRSNIGRCATGNVKEGLFACRVGKRIDMFRYIKRGLGAGNICVVL